MVIDIALLCPSSHTWFQEFSVSNPSVIVCQKTFSDIEKARFCFDEHVKFHKWHQNDDEDDDLHIEFDNITDACDPEKIEIGSMKDEADALE